MPFTIFYLLIIPALLATIVVSSALQEL